VNLSDPPEPYLLDRPWSALLFDEPEHYERVIAKLTAFLEANPTHVPALNNRAIAYWEIGRLDEALSGLALACQHAKHDPLPFKHRGMVLHQMGRPAEAVRQFRHGLEIAPGDAPLLRTLAHALRDAGEIEESLEFFSRAIRASPGFKQTYLDRADIHERLGDTQSAESDRIAAQSLR